MPAWQSEDTNEERCRRNPLEARTSSPRHVSAGWGDGIRTWTMVRRTQSRGIDGSRMYIWPSGQAKRKSRFDPMLAVHTSNVAPLPHLLLRQS